MDNFPDTGREEIILVFIMYSVPACTLYSYVMNHLNSSGGGQHTNKQID